MKPHPPLYIPPSGIYTKGLTVVITSFKRSKYLHRAIASAFTAGVPRVAVTSMEPTPEVLEVAEEFRNVPGFSFSPIGADLGCNELWMQSAYRSTDSRVLLLHDDDFLDPEFGRVYTEQISPFMDKGGFATWRATVRWDDGRVFFADYFNGPTRILPSGEFQNYVIGTGKFSLSPIVTVFDRNTLIGALKECKAHLTHPDCLLHPGMLLGTEIIAHLRNAQHGKGWLYIDKVLSYYGAHDGSGTVKAEKTGNHLELIRGYDQSRAHYRRMHSTRLAHEPKILFVYSDYGNGGTPEEITRFAHARKTWDFHFENGEFVELPVTAAMLTRSARNLGDTRALPFVKDLVNHGMCRARPEDIVVVANRDICLTTTALERLRWGVERGKGVAVAVRRTMPNPPMNRLHRSVTNCKPDGGFDLFAFTPAWWAANEAKLPDMLLGREAWDTCWRMLADEKGADVYLDDITYHEPHDSPWRAEQFTSPSQVYNRNLCLDFAKKRPHDVRARHFMATIKPVLGPALK
jgi:hypothetical protein